MYPSIPPVLWVVFVLQCLGILLPSTFFEKDKKSQTVMSACQVEVEIVRI